MKGTRVQPAPTVDQQGGPDSKFDLRSLPCSLIRRRRERTKQLPPPPPNYCPKAIEALEEMKSLEEWSKAFTDSRSHLEPSDVDIMFAKSLNLDRLKKKAEELVHSVCLGVLQVAEGSYLPR